MSRKQPSPNRLPSQRPTVTRAKAKPSAQANRDFHPALAALTRLLARQIAFDLATTTDDAAADDHHQE